MTLSASASWHDLVEELDAWTDAGRTATFWWRDDDAQVPTEPLGRMVALAESWTVPLALAVIPAGVTPELAVFLKPCSFVSILQHGWSHANHAVPSAKKCELGADRPIEAVLAELAEGKDVLKRLFGPRALPVLVPP